MFSAPQTAGLPSPSDNCGVTCKSATCGEDADGYLHSVDVRWVRFFADKDDILGCHHCFVCRQTIFPAAAPGDAPSPRVSTSLEGSKLVWSTASPSCVADTRINASSLEMLGVGFDASDTASLIAAAISIGIPQSSL